MLAILISFFYKSLLASGRQALSTAPFNIIDIRGKGKGVVAGRDFMVCHVFVRLLAKDQLQVS